jgi:predicted glycoside hydrolase/deacetylase ChbG (UPF0249 family)
MKDMADIHDGIIIAADDYGIRETSRPILALARQGKLDRVGVLVHFVSPDEAEELLATDVKIDIHLELIDFLESGHEHTRSDVFGRGLNFVWHIVLGRRAAREAEAQWEQQIVRFRELFGRLPDGLNSHEHVHYFPMFFRVLVRLAEKYHIPYVRFGTRGILHGEERRLVSGILDFFHRRNRQAFPDILRSSDRLTGLDWLSDPIEFFAHPPEGATELVVHPERPEEYKILSER